MEFVDNGCVTVKEVPMRNAMNEVLRDWYVGDCSRGVERWNRILEHYGVSERLRLPDRKFNRGIGMYSGVYFDPEGHQLSGDEWNRRRHEWLPSDADREYLLSIMASPVYERGTFANYIAPPRRGINHKPVDFEYVRTER
jgi:benzoyl-CoA 2,3-dioxygenase component B